MFAKHPGFMRLSTWAQLGWIDGLLVWLSTIFIVFTVAWQVIEGGGGCKEHSLKHSQTFKGL